MTSIRVQCECGGPLGILNVPYEGDAESFQAVCAGCGTRYRRPLSELLRRAEPDADTVVVLPRSRPRG